MEIPVTLSWLPNQTWVMQVFIIVLATLVANYLFHLVSRRVYKQLTKTKNLWDDALITAAQLPVGFGIWAIGLLWAGQIALQDLENFSVVLSMLQQIRSIALVVVVAWFLIRFIKNVETNVLQPEVTKKTHLDTTTVHAVAKLLRASVLITTFLVLLQTLGYSISGVLAFGGIGGIAVGFAAKDLLANFFGGLMLYLDRPFAVGDWILSPDREIEGTVEEIGWRLTRIRTFSKRPLYVPNSVFANIIVENPSRMTNRRIYETIGLRYDDWQQVSAIIPAVKKMLLSHPEIDTSKTLIVNFNQFAPSSLDFFIYTFTKTTDWIKFHEIKQDVLLKIMEIIASFNAEIAFPTSTVHLDCITNPGDKADPDVPPIISKE